MTEAEAYGQAYENGRQQGREEMRRELLPCKIGDEVWGFRYFRGGRKIPMKGRVSEMYYSHSMALYVRVKDVCYGEWGKMVFANREAAEAALVAQKERRCR